MPSDKKYYKPVSKIKPEDIDVEQINNLKSLSYKIKYNAAGKPTQILVSLDSLISKCFDTNKYTIYALIRIQRILEGTDGDKRTRSNLSRAKMRKLKHSYLP